MVFIELTPFEDFRRKYLNDDSLRALQTKLLAAPDAGDLMRGSGGLRKLRWLAQGRGKRSGARVIYYWQVANERIYLVYGYVKSKREDLTQQQVKLLQQLMADID